MRSIDISPKRVRSRLGSSRSSENSARNSSRESAKAKESVPSPDHESSPSPPSSPPRRGREMLSPGTYSRFPGRTKSRLPVSSSCVSRGSVSPRPAMDMCPPRPTSLMDRFPNSSSAARLISSLKRRMKRSRLTVPRPGGSARRSTIRRGPVVIGPGAPAGAVPLPVDAQSGIDPPLPTVPRTARSRAPLAFDTPKQAATARYDCALFL